MMPTARPFVGEEEAKAVSEVLESGWLGCGPKTKRFEEELSRLLGGAYVVAVNSGTAALHLALTVLEMDPDDEVIVPSLTFCASVQAICAAGGTPVFAEVDPATLCVDVDDVRRRISSRTKAIMPVHYGGQPCEMDQILAIADAYGLAVIEDAAHAFGSTSRGRLIGSFGHITCFSFDPIKTITCGEGGALVLHDSAAAEKIRTRRMLGMTTDGYRRYKSRGGFYEVIDTGYRYHMSDINAAIGLQQLDKFSEIANRRRAIWRQYQEAFAECDDITVLDHDLSEVVPFHFVVRVRHGRRDELLRYLRDHEIGAGIHYPPNHLQPFFRQSYVPLPVTEAIFMEILTLPLYPAMTNDDVRRVIAAVKSGLAALEPIQQEHGYSY